MERGIETSIEFRVDRLDSKKWVILVHYVYVTRYSDYKETKRSDFKARRVPMLNGVKDFKLPLKDIIDELELIRSECIAKSSYFYYRGINISFFCKPYSYPYHKDNGFDYETISKDVALLLSEYNNIIKHSDLSDHYI